MTLRPNINIGVKLGQEGLFSLDLGVDLSQVDFIVMFAVALGSNLRLYIVLAAVRAVR